MRPYLVTIRLRDDTLPTGWRITHLRAIAPSSADAILGVLDRLPFGAFVKVVPL